MDKTVNISFTGNVLVNIRNDDFTQIWIMKLANLREKPIFVMQDCTFQKDGPRTRNPYK